MLFRLSISITFSLLLLGCGLTSNQIAKIQSFGAATEKIGSFGEEEFINIRNQVILMNKTLISLDTSKVSMNLRLDVPTTADATAQRIAASKTLKLYGQLLVSLVTEERSENLRNIAEDLSANASNALRYDLSDEQKNAINTLVAGLGSFYIDKKKADAARSIIPAYEKPVNDLADLLAKDFSVEGGALGYLKAYETIAKRLKNAAIKVLNSGSQYSDYQRERAVEAYALSQNAISRASQISEKSKASIENLKKANSELVKVIKEEEYITEEIKKYGKQIQELVNIHQIITN